MLEIAPEYNMADVRRPYDRLLPFNQLLNIPTFESKWNMQKVTLLEL